ncbi:MAG: crotonase/enoyl-CoA hydratase family protein [Gammaproteobacteria bacterium]
MSALAKNFLDKNHFDGYAYDDSGSSYLKQSEVKQISSSYSNTTECLWLTMASQQRASFNPEMLFELNTRLHINQQNYPNAKAIVIASANPDIFSFGGDLNYIRSLIIKYDREGLFNYIKLNLDVVFKFASHFQQLRIAQVTGAAFDAGFEIALASDVIVAERQATFGFPQLDLNLSPYLGSFYYLSRRVGAVKAQQIISSSSTYTAEELAILGVVDVVVEKGCSTNAIIKYINHHQKHTSSNNSLKQIANRINQAPYSKLLERCNDWVNNALNLSGHELRKIERIVKLQNKAAH